MCEFLPDFKVCSRCKKKKPKEEFNLCASNSIGLNSWCIKCGNIIRRNHRLQYDYNITRKQYELLLKSQNCVCAICNQPETIKRNGKIQTLSVDHNHKTNKIRGLLCQKCNISLGGFNDNLELLEAAAKYLRDHSSSSSI